MSSGNESEFSEDEAYENMGDSKGRERIKHGDVTRSKSPRQPPTFIDEDDDDKSKGRYSNVRTKSLRRADHNGK